VVVAGFAPAVLERCLNLRLAKPAHFSNAADQSVTALRLALRSVTRVPFIIGYARLSAYTVTLPAPTPREQRTTTKNPKWLN